MPRLVADVAVILADRAGDNAQLVALGKELTALGLSVATWQWTGSGLAAGETARLLVTADHRAARTAIALKRRDPQLRLVHIGRPRNAFHWFDLIIAPPHFALPSFSNVLPVLLPLGGAAPAPAETSGQPLPEKIACLILIGGGVRNLALDMPQMRRLLDEVTTRRVQPGAGQIICLTSPRTPPALSQEIASYIARARPEIRFIPYSPDGTNPYPRLLALADEVIATNDSASMPADAVLLGKRLSIFPLRPRAEGCLGRAYQYVRPLRAMTRRYRRRRKAQLSPDIGDRLVEWLIFRAIVRPRREPDAFTEALVAASLATIYPDPGRAPAKPWVPEIAAVARRIHELAGR